MLVGFVWKLHQGDYTMPNDLLAWLKWGKYWFCKFKWELRLIFFPIMTGPILSIELFTPFVTLISIPFSLVFGFLLRFLWEDESDKGNFMAIQRFLWLVIIFILNIIYFVPSFTHITIPIIMIGGGMLFCNKLINKRNEEKLD